MKAELKKMMNYRLDKEKAKTLRVKAIKALAVFFVLMLFFTLLQRTADSMTIAKVETATANKLVIEHITSAFGKVVQNQDIAVNTVAGIKVKVIPVNEGEEINMGSILYELDMDDINEQILLLKSEIKKLDLGISDITGRKAVEQSNQKLQEGRGQVDYSIAANKGYIEIQNAYDDIAEAERKLKEHRDKGADTPIRDTSISENSAYYNALYESERENMQDAFKEKEQLLLDEVLAKKRVYESAWLSSGDGILNAYRTIEDAVQAKAPDSSAEITKLERELKEIQLKKLMQLEKQKGIITAPVDGVVSKVTLTTGNDTPDGMAVLLADLSSGLKFTAQIARSREKYVSRNAAVVLKQGSGKSDIEGLRIDSIQTDSDNGEILNVTVTLPLNEMEIGSTATMDISKKSEVYPSCVPITALHAENEKNYLLILKETESILGTELEAEKLYVTITEKNDKFAALASGSLASGQEFISESNKPVNEGDRIRLIEK